MHNPAEAYEVIDARNDLRKKVREYRPKPGEDPVARAEAALTALSKHFDDWIVDEVARIAEARKLWASDGHGPGEPREAFFRAVHDLKGQATTLGFPLVSQVAGSLCKLLDHIQDPAILPLPLVDQHVDAIRAIVREKAKGEADPIGQRLAEKLTAVTDEFVAVRGAAPEIED